MTRPSCRRHSRPKVIGVMAGAGPLPLEHRSRALGHTTAPVDVITLAVGDLERALAFYRDGLGLQSPGLTATEFTGDDTTPAGAIAMFRLDRELGHLVASRAGVDALLAQAEAAGATVTDPPHDRPWGIYSGYFRDPDGHLWEVIHNPADTGGSG
jgi:uncharacterized protein